MPAWRGVGGQAPDPHLRWGGGFGYPLHDGPRHLGHITTNPKGADETFLAYYHAVRALTSNPEAGALFIEAQDTEALNILGRAIMRRLA